MKTLTNNHIENNIPREQPLVRKKSGKFVNHFLREKSVRCVLSLQHSILKRFVYRTHENFDTYMVNQIFQIH